jgi:DNA-binding GntR family transcriptional regulator
MVDTPLPHIGLSSPAQLKQAVGDMDKALLQDDLDAWVDADSRFHRLLVESSGNARLICIVATVVDQSHRVRLLTLRLRPKPTASNRDYRAVVEAIRKRRPDVAGEVHYQHHKKNGEMLIRIPQRLNLNTL